MGTHPPSSGTSLPDRLPALLAGSTTYRSIISSCHFYNFLFSELPLTVSSISVMGSLVMSRTTTLVVTRYLRPKTTVKNALVTPLESLPPNWYCLVNCVRQEVGYCRIQWQANSATTPDTFQLDTDGTTNANAAGSAIACVGSFVTIPNASLNGITALSPTMAFQDSWCGGVLGVDGTAVSVSVVCK